MTTAEMAALQVGDRVVIDKGTAAEMAGTVVSMKLRGWFGIWVGGSHANRGLDVDASIRWDDSPTPWSIEVRRYVAKQLDKLEQ